jgi:undecaprenyl-diphosphatase
MTIIQTFVLGIVQGVTEFLPISSSGHLVLVPWFMDWSELGLAFSALLHWGTALAVIVAFRDDLLQLTLAGYRSLFTRSLADPQARIAWWVVIGNIPAILIGFFFQDLFHTLFSTPVSVAGFLIINSLILIISERLGKQLRTSEEIQWFDALLIGMAQAAAITPGISRSGATIATGLLLGVKRDEAARFSFLLMIPATLGAGILSLLELAQVGFLSSEWPLLICGFLASAVSGYLAIGWLLTYLKRRPLTIFAIYCASVGMGGLILGFLRG